MKRTRTNSKKLPPIVIDKIALRSLSNIFIKMLEEAEAEREELGGDKRLYAGIYINFSFHAADGIHEQSTDSGIFDDGDTIDRLKAASITMSYSWAERNHLVRLTLQHGGVSDLIISGDNPEWVSAKCAQFDELINSIQPQNMFYRKYEFLFNLIINVSFGYTALLTFFHLLDVAERFKLINISEAAPVTGGFWYYAINVPAVRWVTILSMSAFVGYFISDRFKNSLVALFPLTELQIGPLHKQDAKKRRKIMSSAILIVGMPIATNFFYDFLKKILS